MDRRLELQALLEEMLGSENVFYQPPEDLKLKYPAIVYSKSRIEKRAANDGGYKFDTRYELIVIDRLPDHPIIEELLKLPYCSYDRNYKSDNLNHDVLSIYY